MMLCYIEARDAGLAAPPLGLEAGVKIITIIIIVIVMMMIIIMITIIMIVIML